MFDTMKNFNIFPTMQGNVDIYFIYAAQVPITIKYVDNDTDTEIRNDTVLTLSDFEGQTRTIRSFESFKEKIADRGYITVNDTRYIYNKNAKFSNFAAGNFAKLSKTLTEVGDSSITLPETGTGKSPTITLYYTPTTDLIVQYRTITGDGFDLYVKAELTFVEIPCHTSTETNTYMVSDKPVATIRTATLQIDISNEISETLLSRIIREVSHA